MLYHSCTCINTLLAHGNCSAQTQHSLSHEIVKAYNCCPRASFHTDARARAGFFTEEQAFVWMNKGNLLPPLLLSPLNPIMCHHPSPTRLFPSYRQRQLPIPLNCLLCKVTAEERLLICPRLSCSSLSASLPRESRPENCIAYLWEITQLCWPGVKLQ